MWRCMTNTITTYSVFKNLNWTTTKFNMKLTSIPLFNTYFSTFLRHTNMMLINICVMLMQSMEKFQNMQHNVTYTVLFS